MQRSGSAIAHRHLERGERPGGVAQRRCQAELHAGRRGRHAGPRHGLMPTRRQLASTRDGRLGTGPGQRGPGMGSHDGRHGRMGGGMGQSGLQRLASTKGRRSRQSLGRTSTSASPGHERRSPQSPTASNGPESTAGQGPPDRHQDVLLQERPLGRFVGQARGGRQGRPKVVQFTDAYFQLARSQKAEYNQYFSQDEPVTVKLDGQVYHIDPAPKERGTLTDAADRPGDSLCRPRSGRAVHSMSPRAPRRGHFPVRTRPIDLAAARYSSRVRMDFADIQDGLAGEWLIRIVSE